jgi:hypothetical protein
MRYLNHHFGEVKFMEFTKKKLRKLRDRASGLGMDQSWSIVNEL